MRIEACRICNNKNLIEIGSLGDIAISDFPHIPSEGTKYPLTLVYCEECTLLQLAHNTPRELLYKDYWYQSHINPIIVEDLKEIAANVENGSHIDIGANDGTLLKYSNATVKFAVDPSNIKPVVGEWINDYWEETKIHFQVKYITAIACLYDLPDPNKFMRKIKNSLQEDGVFISQLMTLQPFIDNNDVGNICHEHLEFYSYKSLVRLFEQNGLEIFRVEENNMNGGSYRLFARHLKNGSIDFREKEYTVEDLKDFFKRIEHNKALFLMYFSSKDREGLKIYGYGASTKANTILQYYGFVPKDTKVVLPSDSVQIRGILDVNPLKVGHYTVGSNIPIYSELPEEPDYLWVFPYGFIDYFREKETWFKEHWVTTIPEFKVYEK